ncbi:phage portal protein [Roseomonas mucosa]
MGWRDLFRAKAPNPKPGGAMLFRHLEAASPRGGTSRGWGATPSIPSAVQAGGPIIRNRARSVVLNDPHGARALQVWGAALVGDGPMPVPQTVNRELRRSLMVQWRRFCRRADADGRTDLSGLLTAVVHAMVRDGEGFLYLIVTPDGRFVLRHVPAEFVDNSYSVELGNGAGRIVEGVEFSATGEVVAYHLYENDLAVPLGAHAKRTRVPASDFLHVYRSDSAGQVRGLSWFTPVISTLNEVSKLRDTLLLGASTGAMHAGFLTDLNGSGGLPFEGVQVGSVLESGMEPGTLKILPSGMDIKFNSPQQAAQLVDFLKSQLRAIAAGIGVPDHMVSGDLNGANYSSLRAGLLDFKQRVNQIQYQILAPQLLQPIWDRFVTLAVLRGDVETDDLDELQDVEWVMPAAPSLDPQKEAEAVTTMMAAGLMSRRQAVAQQGYSVEALDAEIAADREREARLRLSFGAPANPKNDSSEKEG